MKTKIHKTQDKPLTPWRRLSILFVFVMGVAVLVYRALDMQLMSSDFYKGQGDARHLRTVSIPAHRGDIVDRNGEPLAISTPVQSVWVNPGAFDFKRHEVAQLSSLLAIEESSLRKKVLANKKREFIYIKRHVSPEVAEKVLALSLPGVALEQEYRRFYPDGEVAAHVVGFADIDDQGQEGVELAFDDWLTGVPGTKRVIRDRLGRAFDDVERISAAQPGRQVSLSIDRRIQYLTYRALKTTVLKHNAKAGSAVVLDVRTGEVLAMANQPSFNVNDRSQLKAEIIRNRAVTDVFEPGSTMKPFSIAAALESGKWKVKQKINTSPGVMKVGGNLIKDARDYGVVDLPGVIMHSSNVGVSKIVLAIEPEKQWDMYLKLGLGSDTGSGFPGEVNGQLRSEALYNDFQRASMAFGYGVSVTPLQLARAYMAIASDGILKPVSFISGASGQFGERVMSEKTARSVREMMTQVVSDKGTGKKAQIPNYSVAGKTGTVHKFVQGGYADDRYISVFAGMVPVSKPELVMVVMIDESSDGKYYGGDVAAPVFKTVMTGALRLLDVKPDRIEQHNLAQSKNTNKRNSNG